MLRVQQPVIQRSHHQLPQNAHELKMIRLVDASPGCTPRPALCTVLVRASTRRTAKIIIIEELIGLSIRSTYQAIDKKLCVRVLWRQRHTPLVGFSAWSNNCKGNKNIMTVPLLPQGDHQTTRPPPWEEGAVMVSSTQ
mmetsp:Transcript_19577/g.28972  ORF Transcript_19577/g.28972 Transcript_19577/m.28972 type:complete len:138 (-) Transcript_19577:488-901(-)